MTAVAADFNYILVYRVSTMVAAVFIVVSDTTAA